MTDGLTGKAFKLQWAQAYAIAIYLGHGATILAWLALTYTVLCHVLFQSPLQVLPPWLGIRECQGDRIVDGLRLQHSIILVRSNVHI